DRAGGEARPRAGAVGTQRLHRMVRPAARPRNPARRGGAAARAPLRHHPGLASDQPADPDEPARERRCAKPRGGGCCRGGARRLAAGDLIAAERRYPHRVGETYQVRYSPEHRWFYFPEMRRDEALVFKVYDSLGDGRARFTAHTSFDDPASPANAPPRQSIE